MSKANRTTRLESLLLMGLLLLAFALRVYRLDGQSIWMDEGISLHLATSSLAEIIADRAANIHPPLYFFLLKGWVALAGVNVFSARFLSAMASLIQVAAVYAVARRWLGRPTAHIAAWLTAFSSVSVIYAQEIRVYALLPLAYLALLGITQELTREPSAPRPTLWLSLAIAETVGLYLHYAVLAAVVYAGGWSLLTFWRQKRWNELRRWCIVQLVVGLTCLPWLIAVLDHWPAVQAEAQLGTALAQPTPLDFLLAQVWAFHVTGLAGALGHPAGAKLASLTALFLFILLLFRLAQTVTRRTTARLMAHWLVPLGLALIAWTVRPFSHPRYIALCVPGLTLLAAYAIRPRQAVHWSTSSRLRNAAYNLPSAALAMCLVLVSLWALRAYLFDPAFAKDDMRTVARYLEKEARPGDLILIPDGDWSLTFIYRGEAPIEMPGRTDEEMWANLTRWTASRQRVFVVGYTRGTASDRRGAISFALEKAGTLISRQRFDDLLVHTYHLDRPAEPAPMTPLEARFGPISLTHGWTEAQAPSGSALTLAFSWHLLPSALREASEDTVQRYSVTIRLLDVDGWQLASRDDLLLDEQLRPTDQWSPGQQTTTYHVLEVPPDTPPLTYTLTVGLYAHTEDGLRPLDLLDSQGAPQGQYMKLADIRLTRPLGLAGSAYVTKSGPPSLPEPVGLADGLQLLGAGLDRSTLSPGQSLFVTLRWRATRSPLPDLQPRLALVQEDQELASAAAAPALGRYPTDRWQAGETVVEHRQLVVPPAASEGPADVTVTLGNRGLVLGRVAISTEERVFVPPPVAYPLDVRFGQVAQLLGYDLPSQTFSVGEPITLTLYWRALEEAASANYTVFTHVLAADDHLVGQHDGPPAGGARPTAGWMPEEIIIDQHTMTFREPYVGPARIEVGLYDPATSKRVPAERGQDFALLPTVLTILER